jgi:hypothetical protein
VFVYKLENTLSGFLEAIVIVRIVNAIKNKYKYQFNLSMDYVKKVININNMNTIFKTFENLLKG